MNNEDVQPIRVLLANSRMMVRAGLREVLEHSGEIEVIAEASDGEQALELIRELGPDVAVVDVQMRSICGIEVAREIHDNCWPVGVLFLTSYDEDPNITSILKTGGNGFVLQTASPDDIVSAVWDVYTGKSNLNLGMLPKVMAQVSRMEICPPIAALSDDEVEILNLVARGLNNRVISERLELNNYTVQWHLIRIFDKLQANNRTEAITRALAMGVLRGNVPGSPDYIVYQN
ncbi:MAG TPA: response regulator transcription factor [Anaerolineaceae bacterium]|nr:response regulator transcription factor [Anaerolineaceae bacterium]